ncbi:hypothetical protein [Hymenobacter ruricola]|uniref:XRE family transcriptional regulator n=1 Tax=Hymenobacter ruricola TaxID=2791023 RepID=A0ABS0IBJ1_9BACT|nr:hypothetical protein [Hymenobacter ruricola]MBF9224330.1 hypothetical protein [Hymenobacter ruricola]
MGLLKKFSHRRAGQSNLTSGRQVQACFGLTQLQLALLLGVSREALAAAEAGRRYLSGPPGVLLSELAQLVQALPPAVDAANSPSPAQSAPALPEYSRNALRLRLMAIGLEEYRLRQQLDRCQTQVAQMQRREQALPALQALLPPGNAYAATWLTQFAADAAAIRQLEEPQAALLALRLRVLAFEASETAALLSEAADL